MQKSLVDAGIVLDADQAAAEKCKRHLWYFVKQFWEVITEDDLEWSAHMQVMCDEIQVVYERVIARQPKLYDLIINIPPGTSKSTICTIMAPAWSWTRDPSLRHITGSYSGDLSTEHAVKSRDIIKSDKYKRYFPDIDIKKDEDNKTNYKTTRGGQRFATSVGGTVTGVHAHVLTFDDPLNPKQAASKAELEEAKYYFDKTIPTRKVDKRITPMVLVMQRLHVMDTTGHLLDKKKRGIRHICLPGRLSKNVKPEEYKSLYSEDGYLDPVRLGREVLQELKIDLGSDGYAGQIDQTPTPEGGRIWKKWFLEVPDAEMPSPNKGTNYSTDWDTAYTKDEENAASAYITTFKFRNKIWIDDLGWDWLEYPDLIKWMKSKPGPHYIEAKASGKSSKQTLTSRGVIAIEVKIKGGSDKIARAKMATPIAEAGLVCIRKSLADKLYNDSRQGILFFPNGQFADMADVLAQCLQRQSEGGVRVMSDERETDILAELDFEEYYD